MNTINTIKKIKKVLVVLPVLSISLLTGCTGMHSQFDCNAKGGIQGCASLGHVNRMADQGDFDRNDSSSSASLGSKTALNESPTGMFLKTPSAGEPLRFGETVQDVWIAPYQTQDGSYVWPSMETVVLQKGHWIGEPVSEIRKSGQV